MSDEAQNILATVGVIWLLAICIWGLWVMHRRHLGTWKPTQMRSWSTPNIRERHGASDWKSWRSE